MAVDHDPGDEDRRPLIGAAARLDALVMYERISNFGTELAVFSGPRRRNSPWWQSVKMEALLERLFAELFLEDKVTLRPTPQCHAGAGHGEASNRGVRGWLCDECNAAVDQVLA